MAKADVKAGRAYVELYIKQTAFVKGLNNARKQLNEFGDKLLSVGARMAAAGAAISGALGGALMHFAAVGDQLDKMSQRTGVSATALAELGFAAEQSGTNIEAVEKVLTRLNKTIGEARVGSKVAAEAMELVGVSAADLATKDTEQIFTQIAAALEAMPNAADRASIAMRIFGKSGTQILPMLESMEALREEARNLGIAPSDEAVKSAAIITDAINRLKRVVGAAMFEIGAAIAPLATDFANTMTVVVRQFAIFVRENGRLIVNIAKTAAKFAMLTAAVIAFGVALKLTALLLAGISFLLMNPAIAMGLVGIFTAAAVAAKLFGDEVKKSFGAVAEFASSGDFTSAWAVIVQTLKVTWLEFTTAIPHAMNEALRQAAKGIIAFRSAIGFDTAGMADIIDEGFDQKQRDILADLAMAQRELADLRARAANQSAAARRAAGTDVDEDGELTGPLTRTFSASTTARAIMEQTRGPAAKQDDLKAAVEKQTAANRENTARIVAAIRDGRLVFT
jgi:TP901 family phage tail tape measure protein